LRGSIFVASEQTIHFVSKSVDFRQWLPMGS
jgi:hypothetical protein